MIRDIQKVETKWVSDEECNYEIVGYNGNHKEMWCKETHSKLAEISTNGVLTIYKGFKWDGCSYKWKMNIFGKEVVLGVWDGFEDENGVQRLYHPSKVHDCLIRFQRAYHGEFMTYKDIDINFYNQMTKQKVNKPQKIVYFCVVRVYSLWRKVS